MGIMNIEYWFCTQLKEVWLPTTYLYIQTTGRKKNIVNTITVPMNL